MSQTSDSPETITIVVLPSDFEKGLAQLEASGYSLVSQTIECGRLVLTGSKRACTCDLCRTEET